MSLNDEENCSTSLRSAVAEGMVHNAVYIVRLELLRVQVGGALVKVLINECGAPADGGERVDGWLGLGGLAVGA